jgi:hypothetical protein
MATKIIIGKSMWWNHEYRHYMRGLKPSIILAINKSFRQFGLTLDGKSDMHLQLIQEHVGEYIISGETRADMERRMAQSYLY